MDKIKNSKLVAFILLILAIITAIGTGFATWIFTGDTSIAGEVGINRGTKTDEIFENYSFSNNTYELYFFPQPAQSVDNPKLNGDNVSYTPIENINNGYWQDAQGNRNYGYKKLTVQLSPTAEDLRSIGTPLIFRNDIGGYAMTFNGWTASRQHSINYRNESANMGLTNFPVSKNEFTNVVNNEYKLADFSKSMAEYDGKGEDGTLVGDHKIFFYAVYTSGKNYQDRKDATVAGASIKQPVVRMNTNAFYISNNKIIPTESYFFDQTWGSNYNASGGKYEAGPQTALSKTDLNSLQYSESYFSYPGFILEPGKKYFLNIDFPDPTDGWEGAWRTINWQSGQLNQDTTTEATPTGFVNKSDLNSDDVSLEHDTNGPFFLEASEDKGANSTTYTTLSSTFLKTEPGLYNIYVYLNYEMVANGKPATSTNVFFNDNLDPDKSNLLKSVRYVRRFDNTSYTYKGQTVYRPTIKGRNQTITMFVKVEKIENPVLLNWANSSNFTNLNNGIRMFRAGSVYGIGNNNEVVKEIITADGHGSATRAVDYYAFNVLSAGSGDKHYIGDSSADKWVYDNYMAYSSTSAPLNKLASALGDYEYDQPLSTRERTQLNSYNVVNSRNDFELPYGAGNFSTNYEMRTAQKIDFTKASNVTGGGIGGLAYNPQAMSQNFARTINFNNFFKPNTGTYSGGDNARFIYSDQEYHVILRFYYTKPSTGLVGSYLSNISVLAVPVRKRRMNVFYLIKESDKDKIKKYANYTNFIDIKTTLDGIKNSGSIYYYTDMIDSTQPLYGNVTNVEASDKSINSVTFSQLLPRLNVTTVTDYLDDNIVYNTTSIMDASRVRILILNGI